MRVSILIVSSGIHAVIMGAALNLPARQPSHAPTAIQIVSVTPPRVRPPAPKPEIVEPPPKARPKEQGAPKRAAPSPSLPEAAPKPAANATPKSEPAAFDSHLLLGNGAEAAGLEIPAGRPHAGGASEPKSAKRLLPTAPPDTAEEDAPPCDAPVTKPRPIDRPAAIEYSAQARADGVQGRLVLKIRVGSDGRVAEVEVVSGVAPALDAAAVEAVKTWRFEPARRCGRPVEAMYTLARRFELGD